MQFSKVMYFIFTCLHFIQYIHYGTAMAADVRRRSGLDLYFTPPPLGLELRCLVPVLLGPRTSQTFPCNGLFRPGSKDNH